MEDKMRRLNTGLKRVPEEDKEIEEGQQSKTEWLKYFQK